MPAIHPRKPNSVWPDNVWAAIERYAQHLGRVREAAADQGGMEKVPRPQRMQLMQEGQQHLEAIRQALGPDMSDRLPYALADARRRRDYLDEPAIH